MDDRFKFRVWDKRKNTYIKDFVFNFINKFPYITVEYFDNEYEYTHTFEEDEIIIEQCTGLTDKNGKLAYEGDIIDGSGIYIHWCNFCKSFSLFDGSGCMNCNEDVIWRDFVEHNEKFEIIGNIHENGIWV